MGSCKHNMPNLQAARHFVLSTVGTRVRAVLLCTCFAHFPPDFQLIDRGASLERKIKDAAGGTLAAVHMYSTCYHSAHARVHTVADQMVGECSVTLAGGGAMGSVLTLPAPVV